MNAQNAKQYLPLVQALAEGKTVQEMNSNGAFKDATELDLRFGPQCYRIKPEPRRWWVVTSAEGPDMLFTLLVMAQRYEANEPNRKIVQVVEVLP